MQRLKVKDDVTTNHGVEDVALMHVDGDERLELGALDLGEVTRRLVDERVEQLEEGLVRLLHRLLVVARHLQCFGRIAGPKQLQAQQANLKPNKNLHEVRVDLKRAVGK